MPPKGQSRRSTRGAKPSSGPDSSNGGTAHSHQSVFKDAEQEVKSRRGGKARTASYQLDDVKPSGRGSKLAQPPTPPEDTAKEDEDDEGGETRCVCDQAEAETQDMGFMVQCEDCEVWQHGNCMGIPSEEDCPEKYYCELCRPDLHPFAVHPNKRQTKSHHKKSKSVHSSRTSHSTSPPPGKTAANNSSANNTNKAPPKRRNTMNSRETDLEHVLDLSRKEAERAGLLPQASGTTSARADSEEPAPGDFTNFSMLSEIPPNGVYPGFPLPRKRKRGAEVDAAETSRKKRAVGSPDSVRSEQPHSGSVDPSGPSSSRAKGKANANAPGNQSPAITQADIGTPEEGSAALGRGRRARKEKDLGGGDDGNKSKHPNQYTYRGGANAANNSAMSNQPSSSTPNGSSAAHKPSPAKLGTNNTNGGKTGAGGSKHAPHSRSHHATNNHNHNHHSTNAQSPSPVPVSYNVPDHFAHLAPLLPHPTPQGITVPFRAELVNPPPTLLRNGQPRLKELASAGGNGNGTGDDDTPGPTEASDLPSALATATNKPSLETRIVTQLEKGVKVRWPPKRTTIGEMRRRVRAMMEYVARAQLDAGERERRVSMLRAAVAAGNEPVLVAPAEVEDVGEALEVDVVGDGPSTMDEVKVENGEKVEEGMVDGVNVLSNPDGGDVEMTDAPKDAFTAPMSASNTPAHDLKPDEVIQASLAPDATAASSTKLSSSSSSATPLNRKDLLLAADDHASTLSPAPSTALALNKSTTNNTIAPSAVYPSTTQLLDELTRELIQFQERFGAGKEGKVYVSSRIEVRERRTRGPTNSAFAGGEEGMF